MKLEIYKPGQGKYTRLGTIVGVMILVVLGAAKLSEVLEATEAEWSRSPAFAFGLPAALTLIAAALISYLVNRIAPADFLIATESEMKKVSWAGRREVVGSTKVVILTTFILAGLLFAVDLVLIVMFQKAGILVGAG